MHSTPDSFCGPLSLSLPCCGTRTISGQSSSGFISPHLVSCLKPHVTFPSPPVYTGVSSLLSLLGNSLYVTKCFHASPQRLSPSMWTSGYPRLPPVPTRGCLCSPHEFSDAPRCQLGPTTFYYFCKLTYRIMSFTVIHTTYL